jgi:PadR family transcriptional regulator, regulatory protein PadR
MSSPRPRLTTALRMVLTNLADNASEPTWGYRICEDTGLGASTVYPILDRLEAAQWVTSAPETPPPGTDAIRGRPPRRLYGLTDAGREAAQSLTKNRRTSPSDE